MGIVILRWIAISLILSFAEVVAYLLTPIVVLFADRTTGKLPRAFWWMGTPTAALPGPTSITGELLTHRGWYVASVYWLWRNSVYALADSFRVEPDFKSVRFWFVGAKACNNDPYLPGYFIGTMNWLDKAGINQSAFEVRIVLPTTKNNCFMIRFGWKLSAWFDGERPVQPTATGMFQALSLRPFLSRK